MWLSKSRIERNLVYFISLQWVRVDFFYELLLGNYYTHRKMSCNGKVSCFWRDPASELLHYDFGNSFTCLGERLVLLPILETGKGCENSPQGERGFQEEVLEQLWCSGWSAWTRLDISVEHDVAPIAWRSWPEASSPGLQRDFRHCSWKTLNLFSSLPKISMRHVISFNNFFYLYQN